MGERYQHRGFEFNGSIQIESRDEQLSGNGGQVLLREVGEVLDLWRILEERLKDPRDPLYRDYELVELVMCRLLQMASGFGDQNDVTSERESALLSVVMSKGRGVKRAREPRVCSQPTLSRLGGTLSSEVNRGVLEEVLLETAGRLRRSQNGGRRLKSATLDIDIFPIDAHGEQDGSAFSPYYNRRVFLAVCVNIAETGDLIGLRLLHGLDGVVAKVLPWVQDLADRAQKVLAKDISLRFDAAFPCEEWLSAWEDGPSPRRYVARIKSNARLKRLAAPHLEKLPKTLADGDIRTAELEYAADSWSRRRRIVLVMLADTDDNGERKIRHFFLITNCTANVLRGLGLLHLYRRRGKAEGHIGELSDSINAKLSSTNRTKSHYKGQAILVYEDPLQPFHVNSVNLLLAGLSYLLLHALRVLMHSATKKNYSIRFVLESIVRVPTRLLVHSRRVHIVIATSDAPPWQAITTHIHTLGKYGAPGASS